MKKEINLPELLFKIIKKTKMDMSYTYKTCILTMGKEKTEELLDDIYHEYRIFLRMLFLRGELNYIHPQLFDYCKNNLKDFKDNVLIGRKHI